MNRRDLLLLRTTSGQRVFELACEQLCMRFVDARRPTEPAAVLNDHWLGEPEPQFESTNIRDLFNGLQRDLTGADVLRVVDQRWLADAELRREVDALVARFRQGGGRVEFVGGEPQSVPQGLSITKRHEPSA
jgi:hypothetical protein